MENILYIIFILMSRNGGITVKKFIIVLLIVFLATFIIPFFSVGAQKNETKSEEKEIVTIFSNQ